MKTTLTVAAILLGAASLLSPVTADAQTPTTTPPGANEGVAGAGGPAGTAPSGTATQSGMRRTSPAMARSGSDNANSATDAGKASAGAGAR